VHIEARKVVSFEYTLTDDSGQLIEKSQAGKPVAYLHGSGNIIPGLEKALDGKSSGDAFGVTIAPEDGYGVHDERLIQNIPIRKLPERKAEVGMQWRVQTESGPRVLRVMAVRGDYAKVDANHPLAGKTLRFDVKVIEVRDATEEELTHGHVHGEGGHNH
jgi:FKBP-type peptidyl-prolyl cis-trans isomerase SlyD